MGGSCLLVLICQSISSHFNYLMHSLYSEGKKHFYFVWPLSEKNCGTFEIGGKIPPLKTQTKPKMIIMLRWVKMLFMCKLQLLNGLNSLDSRILVFWIPGFWNSGFWILDSRFWIPDSGSSKLPAHWSVKFVIDCF